MVTANSVEALLQLSAGYYDGFVAHTPTSRLLRQDHPQSMRSFVRMFGLSGFWAWRSLGLSQGAP